MHAADTVQIKTGPNVLGALIFFGYIIAALVLTWRIFSNIVALMMRKSTETERVGKWDGGNWSSSQKRALSTKRRKEKERSKGWRYFPVAASVSFAVLSWNMLMFLVNSYMTWTTKKELPLADDLRTLHGIAFQLQQIWAWSTHTTLFQTFAEFLLSSPETWKRIRLVLLYSYGLNMWMSFLGRERRVPNLWQYFLIDQILPVSFAQNLCCTALTLVQRDLNTAREPKPSTSTRILSVVSYLLLLYTVPYSVGGSLFIAHILLVRMLLFAPYLIDMYTLNFQAAEQHSRLTTRQVIITCTYLLAAAGLGDTIFELGPLVKERAIEGNNYASAALSQDLWLGVVSAVVAYRHNLML